MVIGEYHTKIGKKRRVSIPKKFRKEMGNDLIITRGYEKALVLVNKDMWSTLASEIINGSFINKNIRETNRFLVGSALEVSSDKLGRILIPSALTKHADLRQEVVFIGLVNWVEIWSKEVWQKKQLYLTKNSEKIAKKLENMDTIES